MPQPVSQPNSSPLTWRGVLLYGIASALFKRERTGEASVVDVSLLSSAMWVLASDVVYSGNPDYDPHAPRRRRDNPLTGSYRTADGRWITLVFLQPDRYWEEFCRHLDRPELIDDATLERYEKRYDTPEKMGQLITSDYEIELLSPDAAIAHGRWMLEVDGDNPSGLYTLVMRKIADEWVIVSDTTTSAD